MAPIPSQTGAAPTAWHVIARRDAEQGRIAGMLVGCLLGGLVAVTLVYFCFNCVLSPKKKAKNKDAEKGHATKPHPHHHVHAKKHRQTGHTHTHAHAHAHAHAPHPPHASHAHSWAHHAPHAHRWTHHHHRHAHRHHNHHQKHQKAKPKHAKAGRKPSRRTARPKAPRGPAIRFMPMPPMEVGDVPFPAPVAGVGLGMGMGMGMGVGMMGMDMGMDMGVGPEGDFVDYGPPPEEMDEALDGGFLEDPGVRLERFEDDNDVDDDGGMTGNECCFAFWDALCGIEPRSRELRREVVRDEPVLGGEEMAGE